MNRRMIASVDFCRKKTQPAKAVIRNIYIITEKKKIITLKQKKNKKKKKNV